MGVLYQKYQCPSCNEAVVFKHVFTNFAVCNNCKSVVQNEPKKAVQLTAYASFTNTVSPINIGMKGNWQNKNFEVIGGSRVWMQETVFHYWTIIFSDNTYGWLSEGYGLFAICLETKPNQVINYGSLNSLKTGDKRNQL
jgi:transcription elongation factor Elf1